jgi:hypothetical protein
METKKQSEKRLYIEIVKQMITLATSGFGVVAALAWNNVIQEVVNTYIKPYLTKGSGLISLLIYAVGITVLAVTITYQLSKIVTRLTRNTTDPS